MKILTRPHQDDDNHDAGVDVGRSPKSIVRGSERDINLTMAGINGRPGRKFYGPATRGFWRPPPDVQDAISRGNRKCRGASS